MAVIDNQHKKTVLPNGLRIVTERIEHVRSVSIGVWVMVGARDENPENNGISHYIEHMLFKGTTNQSAADIAQSLESVGGHLNAFTSKELTCYYAHILDEYLPLAVEVISDIINNSVFDATEMEKEKRVILDELGTIEETPEELIHDIFWEDLFPGHPLGLSIIGKRDTITGIGRDGVLNYMSSNYTSDRIIVAATGNVDHDNLVALLADRFENAYRGVLPDYSNPAGPRAGRNVVENGAIQSHVCLGTLAYPYRDRKKFPLLLLNTLLGAGMSSRLFQNIREKYGIAYSIYSFIDFLFDTGIFGIYLGTDDENTEQAIQLIYAELKHLKDEAISSEELMRTKSQLKGNLMLGLESTSSRMNRIAKMEIYLQNHFSLDETLADIDAVTSEQIQEVANELFQKERLHTTILKPKNNGKKRGQT